MNILFFSRRFWPDIGGVEKHVYEISNRLASKGYKIVVVTQSAGTAYGKESRIVRGLRQTSNSKRNGLRNPLTLNETIHGIQVIRIPKTVQTKFSLWQWLWRNRSFIEEADIIHCHDVFFWYLPFRFFYPRKRVYTTFHGYESYPIKKKAIIVRKISEALSWGNICIGDFITKWYGTKPTVVSYGAVNSSKFKVQSSKLREGSAVFFGRLDEQTGIKTYNKAFEILKKKYPKFRLLVVGDGKYHRFLNKDIQVKGFQKEPERYFEKYRFAFVSRYLSILEAFAAKRLVFAVYDNPVKEDYLRMTPFAKFMIITKDPSELARKVQFFLEHPELEKKMIAGAYKYAKQQTWSEMIQMYLLLWKARKKTKVSF